MIRSAVTVLERATPTDWVTILLFCAATAAFATGSVFAFEAGLLHPAVAATGGLVSATLLCNAAALIVIVGGILLGMGRLKLKDAGLCAAKLPQAVIVTLALWAVVQLGELVIGLIQTGAVGFHEGWATRGPAAVIGTLIGQLFGNALFEEIAYRGFLLRQLYLKLRERWPVSPVRPFILALLLSQGFFALTHIPIRLHQGAAVDALPANLLATVAVGVFFCWAYLQTGNLLIAVGVHALINSPTPLLDSPLSPQLAVFVAVVLMLLLWPLLVRRNTHLDSSIGQQTAR
jgi:membrane protease YdiL (CAAX protease family)